MCIRTAYFGQTLDASGAVSWSNFWLLDIENLRVVRVNSARPQCPVEP
jgi:hypothetical protein